METPHKTAGLRAIREVNAAFALLIPAVLCVGVPLMIGGFSWSNLSIVIGLAILLCIPFLMTRALRKIHESDKAARAAGEDPHYLERLLRDTHPRLARRR